MKLRTLQKRMVALSIHLCGVVTNCGQWGLLIFRRWWPLASTFLGLSHIADTYFWTMVMVALSIHLCGVVTNCGQWGLLLFRRWWPLASTFLGLSHIADKYFWTMVMVALSIHLCGVVTNCGQWGLLLFRRWWPLASTFLGLSHIADKYFWTMVMVARSIHLCGVVTCDTKYVLRWGCVSFQTLMVALRALLCAVVTYSAPIRRPRPTQGGARQGIRHFPPTIWKLATATATAAAAVLFCAMVFSRPGPTFLQQPAAGAAGRQQQSSQQSRSR